VPFVTKLATAFDNAKAQLQYYTMFIGGAITAEKAHAKALKKKEIVLGMMTKQIPILTGLKLLWMKAQLALNAAMKANPFGVVIAGIVALVAVVGGAIAIFKRFGRAAREQEQRIGDLSKTWNKDGSEIRAEMDKYGLTIDEWEAKQNEALDGASDKWGISSEEIKAALAEQEISLAQWEAQQYEMLQGVADEWGMSTNEVLAEMAKQGITAEQWSAQMGQAWDDFQGDVARNVGNIVNGFREIPTEYGKSAKDLRTIMDNNIATTEAWRENMAKIAGEVPDEMLEWLESQGPEFSSVIDEMLSCEKELEAWKETFANATALGTEQALENIEDPAMKNAFIYKLDDMGQAVAENMAIPHGMESLIDQCADIVREGGQRLGEEFGEGAEDWLESFDCTPVVKNVAEATNDIAEYTERAMKIIKTSTTVAMEHFSATVKTHMECAEKSVESSLTRITGMFDSFRTKLPEGLFSVGSDAMESMKRGMLSRQESVLDAVRRIISNVVKTFRDELEIGASSRVTLRLGEATMDGFAIGMERMQSRVNKVVSDTVAMVTNGFNQALAQSRLSEDMTLTVIPEDSTHQNNALERLVDVLGSERTIVLDSGELIGATRGRFDVAIGQTVSYNTRWGR
jgi:phage-related protein